MYCYTEILYPILFFTFYILYCTLFALKYTIINTGILFILFRILIKYLIDKLIGIVVPTEEVKNNLGTLTQNVFSEMVISNN